MSKIPVFDIGDTLVPSRKLQNRLMRQKFEQKGVDFSNFDIYKFRIYNPGEIQDYLENQGVESFDAEKIVREYKRQEKQFMEKKKVFETLKKCSAEFGEIGIISDLSIKGKRHFESMIEDKNVPYRGFVVSEEVGVEKPNLKIFREFLDKREEPAERFTYIGNHAERDSASKDLGMDFVWCMEYDTFGTSYQGSKIDKINMKNLRNVL